MSMNTFITSNRIMSLIRLALGFTFLWAFLDKLFGLGFATPATNAWIAGGSPTTGFLTFAVKGPFAGLFTALAGMAWVDWAFMAGLLFVGVTLIINRWVTWGAVIGIGMLLLMYLALLFPENNPIIDDHIIYALVLGYIALQKNAR